MNKSHFDPSLVASIQPSPCPDNQRHFQTRQTPPRSWIKSAGAHGLIFIKVYSSFLVTATLVRRLSPTMTHNFSALLTSPLPFVPPWTSTPPALISYAFALICCSTLVIIITRRLSQSDFVRRIALRALRIGGPIPLHVAFIMDGNRRWARRLGLPAHAGHPEGGDKLLQSLQWCLDAGVRTVTVYAFSLENYKRASVEVNEIMTLAERTFHSFTGRADFVHINRVRVRVLGDLSRITPSLRRIFTQVMADTRHYDDSLTLNVCFAYTARHDMATAVRDSVILCRDGTLEPEALSQHIIAACLSSGFGKGASPTATVPDLLVRTSGETRLSDFLLWETHNTVLSFCPTLWPDFSSWDLVNIILDYQRAVRIRDAQDSDRTSSKSGKHNEFAQSPSTVQGLVAGIRERYFDEMQSYCEVIDPT